jgi:hypothetical protein
MTSRKGSLAGSLFLGLTGASAALGGWWLYLTAAVLGIGAVLLTLAQPIHGLLGFIVLAPELSPYAQLNLPAGVPDLTFPRAAVGLVAAALLVGVLFATRRLRPLVAVEKVMLAFVILVYVDLYVRSPSFESDALIVFDEFATPFLFFYFARNLIRTSAALEKFAYAMVLTGLVLAFHGIFQYATYGSIGEEGAAVTEERSDTGHVEKGRAAGPFINAVEFGGSVGFALVWGLFLFFYRTGGLQRLALLPLAGILGLAAVLSLTRAVWLGLLVGILTVAVFDRRYRVAILTGVAAAGVIGVLVLGLVSDDSRMEERAFSTEPMYIRLVMYRAALSMIVERPVFGYGRGESTFVDERQRHLVSVGSIPADFGNMAGPPHNVYLFTLLQWGVVGLGLYLAIFYLLIRRAMSWRRAGKDDSLARACAAFSLAATAIYMIQAVFADVVAFTFLTNVYFLGAGAFEGVATAHETEGGEGLQFPPES